MMTENVTRSLLPIGSIVQMDGCGNRKFLIYGRMVKDDDGVVWDYIIGLYPEGFTTEEDLSVIRFAKREWITKLVFLGYRNAEEEELREVLEAGGEWDYRRYIDAR